MRYFLALALVASATGCGVTRAAWRVSKDLAADCVKHCAVLDMRLAAVVVVADAGGCVCEPKGAPATESPRASSAAAAGGGAYVAAAAAAQQQ